MSWWYNWLMKRKNMNLRQIPKDKSIYVAKAWTERKRNKIDYVLSVRFLNVHAL
jgi:hypothetical protein